MEPGSVAVDAGLLAEIAKRCDGSRMELVMDFPDLVIRCEGAEFTLPTMDLSQLPKIPQKADDDKDVATVSGSGEVAGLLSDLLGRVLYAAGRDETRYNLCGVHIEIGGGVLRATGTNGHRLATAILPFPVPPIAFEGVERNAIVPSKAAGEARKLLDDAGEGQVELGFRGDMFIVETPEVRFSARIVAGDYPDWRQSLLSDESDATTVLLPVNRTLAAFGRVEVGTTGEGTAVSRGVLLHWVDGEARLSASTQGGAARETVPDVPLVVGPSKSFEVALNATYVRDCLTAIGGLGDTVNMTVKGGLDPMYFRLPAARDRILAVIMPMKA